MQVPRGPYIASETVDFRDKQLRIEGPSQRALKSKDLPIEPTEWVLTLKVPQDNREVILRLNPFAGLSEDVLKAFRMAWSVAGDQIAQKYGAIEQAKKDIEAAIDFQRNGGGKRGDDGRDDNSDSDDGRDGHGRHNRHSDSDDSD